MTQCKSLKNTDHSFGSVVLSDCAAQACFGEFAQHGARHWLAGQAMSDDLVD